MAAPAGLSLSLSAGRLSSTARREGGLGSCCLFCKPSAARRGGPLGSPAQPRGLRKESSLAFRAAPRLRSVPHWRSCVGKLGKGSGAAPPNGQQTLATGIGPGSSEKRLGCPCGATLSPQAGSPGAEALPLF